MGRKYPPPRKRQVLFYKFDKKIALKCFLNFHILSSKNLATNPTKTPPLHTPHRLLPPKETTFATKLKTKKDFTNVKDFFHYSRLRIPTGSWAKTCEARLAGQAAIEGLSAPMRLPSAIAHTPKRSEYPFERWDSAVAQTTQGTKLDFSPLLSSLSSWLRQFNVSAPPSRI